MWAKWMGAKMAISCTNGTAALHIALASLNIGPGDEVIVPSYSFIASSFSAVQAGAIPVFADVTDDHTLDPDCIEPLITERTKAIIEEIPYEILHKITKRITSEVDGINCVLYDLTPKSPGTIEWE